jgi:hypothetical protein
MLLQHFAIAKHAVALANPVAPVGLYLASILLESSQHTTENNTIRKFENAIILDVLFPTERFDSPSGGMNH